MRARTREAKGKLEPPMTQHWTLPSPVYTVHGPAFVACDVDRLPTLCSRSQAIMTELFNYVASVYYYCCCYKDCPSLLMLQQFDNVACMW